MIGAIMLGLGRALGEAVAVTIIFSLSFGISPEILHGGGISIAALIASRAPVAPTASPPCLPAGFILFVFTLVSIWSPPSS